jgi:hypothetical protein
MPFDAVKVNSDKADIVVLWKKLLALSKENPAGFTVDTNGNSYAGSGYAVGIESCRNLWELATYVVGNPGTYAGGWFDRDSGIGYFDATRIVADRDAAIRLGLQCGQIALWDFNSQTEIDLRAEVEANPVLREWYYETQVTPFGSGQFETAANRVLSEVTV